MPLTVAQQPVISIRISEALRLKLEGLKVLMSMKSGEPVSTSEAAKQLLESSKEERLELVSLLTEPTDSLLMIRRKADSKLPLSQAEWTAIAYFCLHGVERFANTAQTEISYESLAGILEAFQAVYGLLRKPNKTHLDSFFVAHLPPDRQAEAKKPEEIGSDDVRRAVTRTALSCRLEYGPDQLERLVEALPPLLERHAHRVVVGLGRTRADTGDHPAIGQHVQRRQRLGQWHRPAQGRQRHGGHQLHLA